jgi:hypothetical protein
MPEEGMIAVPADPVNLELSYIQQRQTRAYPVIYARRWSDAPTNSDWIMSWIINDTIRLAHLMLIFGRYHTAYQPIETDKQGGRTYYQSTLASLTSRLKSLNRCCISSSSVASSSFSYMGRSALCSLGMCSLSNTFGRAWQNKELSDIMYDKVGE